MQQAERGLRPRELVGLTLLPQEQPQPADPEAADTANMPDQQKPESHDGDVMTMFQNLLDRLF